MKNIAKPVRAYLFSPDAAVAPTLHAFRPFVDMPVEAAPKVTGGCLCGNIRYETSEPELGSMYCQCRMCQKFTGAPIMAATTFRAEGVRITRGEPKFYKSSKIAERGFCPDCGTSLFYRMNGEDGIGIAPGCLDGADNLTIGKHIFVKDKADYYEIGDGKPQIDSY